MENFLHKHSLKNGIQDNRKKPAGSESIHSGIPMIKTSVREWKSKHVVIWEAANGPMPNDHMIIFADRDPLNTSLDNLLLVSKQELVVMNRFGLISANPELTKMGKTIVKLKMLINKHNRELKEKRKYEKRTPN
jgi:hypothetical protein